MIDPRDVTKFDRTQTELEEYWLFCIVAAGKTAMTQARLLDGYLKEGAKDLMATAWTPFDIIRYQVQEDKLLDALKASRLGQYNRLKKAFEQSVNLDLRSCTVADLEAITGVGPKTARFFILHTRPDQSMAVLDTHILKYLRDKGHTTQKVTPPAGKKYNELEAIVIAEAKASGMSQPDFDLHIWKTYSGNA
jgi:thermostable 8-oxoguanine DNA glycosylase